LLPRGEVAAAVAAEGWLGVEVVPVGRLQLQSLPHLGATVLPAPAAARVPAQTPDQAAVAIDNFHTSEYRCLEFRLAPEQISVFCVSQWSACRCAIFHV
jgi:hypothetical protein